jgi:hypothetical protein
MFEIKNKDGKTIEVEPQMLFSIFLKDINENKQHLLLEVDQLEKYFFNIFDETSLLNSPLIKIMNLFFLLGYQYSSFKDKNETKFINKDSKTDTI